MPEKLTEAVSLVFMSNFLGRPGRLLDTGIDCKIIPELDAVVPEAVTVVTTVAVVAVVTAAPDAAATAVTDDFGFDIDFLALF